MRALGVIAGGTLRLELVREQRFAEFVAKHRDRAVSLAWRLVGDVAAAEDIAQEAFIRAFRGLGGFREEARMSTWFYRILVNEARRHLRWRWVRDRVAAEMPDDVGDPRATPNGDPALRERVRRALARLPRGQREAFVLVYLEGMTITEAASVASRADGTIKSHLHRALASLRRELADLAPRPEARRT